MPSPRLRLGTVAGVLALAATGVALSLLLGSPSQAVPARPSEVTLTQPDGQKFEARLYGDEWHSGHETSSGHTILRDERGRWTYAHPTPAGALRPSDQVVGRDRPLVRPHLRDRALVARASRLREAAHDHEPTLSTDPRLGLAREVQQPLSRPSLGADRSLVILAQFTDQANLGTAPGQWSDAYFGTGKSVAGYYKAASGGKFTLAAARESHGADDDGVVGWVTLPMNHPNTTSTGSPNRLATKNAILAADPYVDYASYDTNGDGQVSNTELHVTVIVAGSEASYGVTPAKFVWGHQWSLGGTVPPPVVDGRTVGGHGYTQFGEKHGDHMATMGIMVHEMGHDLSLPDLYDIDGSSAGVGIWSVMGGGSWGYVRGTDTKSGETPPLLDAWSRSYKGWVTPDVVSGTETRSIAAATSGTSGVAVQLLANPGGPHDWSWGTGALGEYFLVENRQRTGYDASLPGSGLLVWHVDERRANNANDAARLVDVEEADGLNHLDSRTNRGDADDLFRAGGRTTFDEGSNPHSRLNNGAASGAAMSNVSASGATMSATFSTPGPPAAPTGVQASAGNRSATVSWSPSATNGSPISGYTVTASPGGAVKNVSAGTTSALFDKLTNGQAYTFTVRATNALGTSPPAESAPVVPAAAPDAPRDVAAVPGSGSAVVSWSPAADNGSPVTEYTVTAQPDGATRTVSGDTASTKVSGLAAGTAYTFTVTATSATGTSPASAPSNRVTPTEPLTPADVGLELSLVDRPEKAGFAYRVTARETGDAARNVSFTLALPSSVELLEAPATCSDAAPVTCDLGDLDDGAAVDLDFDVRPSSPGPHEAQAALVVTDGGATDTDPGNDSAAAVAGVDFVCDNEPTAGNDRIRGTASADVLCGLGGRDTIAGGGGDDLLLGGAGLDTLSYARAASGVRVDLNLQGPPFERPTASQRGPGAGDGTDHASGFERLKGSPHDDVLVGHLEGSEKIRGLGGRDKLYGWGGSDRLHGGAGADQLLGLLGSDRLVGGHGRDVLDGGSSRDRCTKRSDTRISCET